MQDTSVEQSVFRRLMTAVGSDSHFQRTAPKLHCVCVGGGIKPSKSMIKDKLSNLTDQYDDDEPEPVPHFFDAKSSPTQKVLFDDKGSVP